MAWGIMEPLAAPLEAFLYETIMFFPKLIWAIALLIIGAVIGTMVARVIKELMLRAKIDQHISKRGPMLKLSDIFPLIFEWTVYLVFIKASVEALEIQALVDFIGMIVNFMPGLIGSIVVVIVGYIMAGYVKRQVEKSKIEYSDIMGKILFWLMVYIAFALALPLINIDTTIINYLLLITIGSIGVGLAIAIGFGLKDVIRDLARKKFRKSLR